MSTQAQLFRLIRDFLVSSADEWERFVPPEYLDAEALAVCVDADWEQDALPPRWMVARNLAAYMELLADDPVEA